MSLRHCSIVDAERIIGEWSLATFGPGERFRPHIEHIRRELTELENCKTSTAVAEEMADVLILLLGFAYRNGVDLAEELERKHAVNLERRWCKPDAMGVTEHVRR